MSLWESIFGKQDPFVSYRKWTGSVADSFSPEVVNKSLELLKGCHPSTNMVPTMRLVNEAWKMGYEITRKRP